MEALQRHPDDRRQGQADRRRALRDRHRKPGHRLVQPGLAVPADLQGPAERQPGRSDAKAGRHEAGLPALPGRQLPGRRTRSPTRFNWKKTLGPIDQRPGHLGPWGYRSTDGMGLLEFLEWCEDMKASRCWPSSPATRSTAKHVPPARSCSLRAGRAGRDRIRDRRRRARSGARSVPTTAIRRRSRCSYVEIGNEDGFDQNRSYDGRFTQFYDAIKAEVPAASS